MLNIKWFKSLLVATLTMLAVGAASAQGVNDVTPLNPPQPVENDGKTEVLEFFSYACGHCANLEPSLAAWAKRQPADVKLKRIPVDGINGFMGAAGLFYTLEAMGQLERLHGKIFEAIHVERLILANPAILNKWLEKNGVDPRKYEELQKSFTVDTNIKRARKMNADYKISSVPAMVVNGRFQVAQTAGPERLFGVIDRLIADVRVGRKAAAVKTAVPAK